MTTEDPGAPDAAQAAAARSRRELGVALVLLAAGAVAALTCSGRTWLQVSQPGSVPALSASVVGRDLTGAASGLGLLGLAGVAAVAATRRGGRIVVGALLALLALLLGADVVRIVLVRPIPAAVPVLTTEVGGPVTTSLTGWPALALVAVLLVAAGGLLVAVRGRRWAALSSAYTAPTGDRPAAARRDAWDRLDDGDDPTERPPAG